MVLKIEILEVRACLIFYFIYADIDLTYGDNAQQCYVSIKDAGGANEAVTTGCRPKNVPGSLCGSQLTIAGETFDQCCCDDGDNCNDDAFIAKCKAGTAPTVIPKGLTCNLVAGSVSTTQDCSSKLF